MQKLVRLAWALAASLAGACGTTGGGGTPALCSVAVGGALTATSTCQLAVATSASSGGKVTFGLEALAGNITIAAQVTLSQTALSTGTYSSTSGVGLASAAASVTTTAGLSWLQFYKTATVPDQGSVSLTVTSAGSSVPSGAYTGWPDPGGSLTVTLLAVTATGATATVTVTASF